MIVPKMTSEQIYKEIFNEYPSVMRKATRLTESLRRTAIKSRNKYAKKVFYFISENKNKWLIFAEHFVSRILFTTVVYYDDNWGFNAILVNVDRSLSHYTEHFLDRFNERYLKEPFMPCKEIVKRFFFINSVCVFKFFDDADSCELLFMGKFTEGNGLGYVERVNYNRIFHFSTYLSSEMLFENQNKIDEKLSKRHDAYWKQYWQFKHKIIQTV